MGLFGAVDPSPDLLAKLANEDRASRKRVAREEVGLLAALNPGERVLVLGYDAHGSFGVAVVTSERIFQVKRGRTIKSADWDRLRGTRLLVRPDGRYLAAMDGPGLYPVTFGTAREANRFVGAIDLVLEQGVPGPRDIPALYPAFYEHVLRTLGKPASDYNVAQLGVRTADMIEVGGANAFFDQLDAVNARAAFQTRFSSVDDEPDALMRLADDMIDFLWAWAPNCHVALRKQVDRIFELFTMPESPLWRDGDVITPWGVED
ncbi:hypothetical protein ADK67_31840 [Saccharothrix sp. NRRL B-16348]|uniref:hypothetical protein n=1 Tax=Saccharothrix sp. NRRL B-16348 TaxID=1415542 RepID=UPI0006AF5F4A|nr:hypothetical protein [Saccharothrix sp. NRRL B-16348]KOX20111.1 hypothetical protein ADK67_31840 [Saccharothrix sp. NRRL B-16348]